MSADQILRSALAKAKKGLQTPAKLKPEIRKHVEYVCRCQSNRAGIRLLMSCLLAKIDQPHVDPRKPYTEIKTPDSFSGRVYDEKYLTHFIIENDLPCNRTTAFLTPALRNNDRPLTLDVELIGSPRDLYVATLKLLDAVYRGKVSPSALLVEAIRLLLLERDEKRKRMASLLEGIRSGEGALPLSCEAIVKLLEQHLACRNASRLPVLMVAAAYNAAGSRLGERAFPLKPHNAADLQTGAIGDVEVCIVGDDKVVTVYEMKLKPVTIDDIDTAMEKISRTEPKIHNYIFITTEPCEKRVSDYAAVLYQETGGTEVVILDCIGFIRHFLHLFHRLRTEFLNAYQEVLLREPASAASQPLKEAFLALRQAAESDQ